MFDDVKRFNFDLYFTASCPPSWYVDINIKIIMLSED